jgi:hypothetical protein
VEISSAWVFEYGEGTEGEWVAHGWNFNRSKDIKCINTGKRR